jgi:hypothetical protein
MDFLLKNLAHSDVPSVEENGDLMNDAVSCMTPRALLEFSEAADLKRATVEKRPEKYRKLHRETKLPIWKELAPLTSEDVEWLVTYESVYRNPDFWNAAWTRLYARLELEDREVFEFVKSTYENREPVRRDGGDAGDVLEIADAREYCCTLDEYLIRCVEIYLSKGSILSIANDVGKKLFFDERVSKDLAHRNRVPEYGKALESGILRAFDVNARRIEWERATPEERSKKRRACHHDDEKELQQLQDEDSSSVNDPSASDMFDVFCMLEKNARKCPGHENYRAMKDPASVMIDVISKANVKCGYETKLYWSAYTNAVIAFCCKRCLGGERPSLVFLAKPKLKDARSARIGRAADGPLLQNDDSYYAYDLDHNLAFCEPADYFVYNAYMFGNQEYESKKETFGASRTRFRFSDSVEAGTNSCIELGWATVEKSMLNRWIYSKIVPASGPVGNKEHGLSPKDYNSTQERLTRSLFPLPSRRQRKNVPGSDEKYEPEWPSVSSIPDVVRRVDQEGQQFVDSRRAAYVLSRKHAKTAFDDAEGTFKYVFEEMARLSDENALGGASKSRGEWLEALRAPAFCLNYASESYVVDRITERCESYGIKTSKEDVAKALFECDDIKKYPVEIYESEAELYGFDARDVDAFFESKRKDAGRASESSENDPKKLGLRSVRRNFASSLSKGASSREKTTANLSENSDDNEPTDYESDASGDNRFEEEEEEEEEEEKEIEIAIDIDSLSVPVKEVRRNDRKVKITITNLHKDEILFAKELYVCGTPF